MESSTTLIHTIPFSELDIWDVKSFFHQADIFNSKYPVVLFGEFLKKASIDKISIDNDKEYKILGARAYGKGAFVNRIVKGDTLKMRKYQKAKKDHLYWCKVDTKNGAFGIITEDLADGVGSSNMTFASIDTEKANPDFVQLLFRSRKINEYMDGYVSGTTNRKYIKPDQLRNEIKIVLPDINEQNRIVSEYDSKIRIAEEQEKKAKELEIEIEKYILDSLELSKLKERKSSKGLQFINYKNIERWDILAKDLRIINGLSTSKYELKKLGEVFQFPSRSWKKKEFNGDEFHYIELGAIDEILGITTVKKIDIKKAPSRATQKVQKGDLIIGTTRPYLKRFAIVTEENDGDICSSGFSIVAPNPKYDLTYLKEFLFSYYGIEQLKNRMTGATYPAITNSELKEILIPFPSVQIQREIGNHIDKLKQTIIELKRNAEENRAVAIKEFEREIFSN
ncbi:restriction endonuclease subunit S [Gilvibacter sp.]|uniref:restriction endonuclease subunit S n=1 Tax=Gilvibacter sp. TaxID=2729997 RepID=UPI003F4A46CE